MTDLPTVITKAGLTPRLPDEILATLIAKVAATNPGYTANLPSSLIEDISSTDVASISECDQARVELVNSLTPFGANDFLLNQLGQQAGVPLGLATRTSALVVFSGPPGFVIGQGFQVSDGTYQYTAVDGGVIGTGSMSAPLFCVATISGSWVVPSGSVTQIVTSVPPPFTGQITCTNPSAGISSIGAQTSESYRVAVLQAGKASATGMATLLKTTLALVSGVQPRLISVLQQPNNGGWEIIVGGGDPYQVAFAIYSALFDINSLVGSTLNVSGISNAANGVITTALNHGFVDGQVVQVTGATGITGINNVPITVHVLTEKTFQTGINTIFSGTYTGGGILTPNPRNIVVSLQDYPNTYLIPYVLPPQQTVTMTVTWNTSSPNFVSASAVSQLGAPALIDYINNLSVGVPINLFELQTTFQAAIADILLPQFLTRMEFAVAINGIGVSPISGTGIIAGDPESYFLALSDACTIEQG